jgi:hypothetical protein
MGELDVRCEVVVRRSPEEVWRYVAEQYVDHHGCYDPAVVSMRLLTDEPMGVGVVGEEGRKMGPRVQRTRFRVTAFEPPRQFAITDLNGPFALDRSYAFEPDAAGTRVSFRFTMRPKGPMRLLFPLLRNQIEAQVKANIDRLPEAVEAVSGQSA